MKMDNETKKEPATDNPGEGSEPKATPSVEQSDKMAERLEAQNKSSERLEAATAAAEQILIRRETVLAKEALGGKTDAGSKKEEKVEESPQEYSQKLLDGKVEFDSSS